MKDYSKDAAVDSNRFSPCHYFWYRIVTYIVLVTFSSSLIAPTALAYSPASEKDNSSKTTFGSNSSSSSSSKINKVEKVKKTKLDNLDNRVISRKLNYGSSNSSERTKETKTLLFFSPQSEYQPYFEIGGAKYFNQNTSVAGIYDLFIPLLQNDTNLIFTDLRIFDRSGSSFEGNVHLGYRKLFPNINQMIGIYGAFDRKRSDDKSLFSQLTVGVEYWYDRWFIGGNAYKPIGNTKKYTETSTNISKESLISGRSIIGTKTKTKTNGYYERAFPGVDAELGFAITDNLTSYVGGYYFHDDDADSDIKTVAGPKIRVTYDYRTTTGRLLGALDGVSVEVGAQHDKPRGNTAYIGLRFKVGLTNFDKNSNISGFERHMIDLVRRDPDIVVNKTVIEKEEINKQGYIVDPPPKSGTPNYNEWTTEDLLKEFGLPKEATLKEVTKMYHKRTQKDHPDKYGDKDDIVRDNLINDVLSERLSSSAAHRTQTSMSKERHFGVYVGAGVESNTLNNTNNALTYVGTNLSEPNYKYSNLDIEKVLTYKILEDVATKDTKTTNEKTNLRNIAIISPLSQKDLEILADQFRESLKKELKIPGRKILLPVYLDDKSHWVSALLENKEGTIDIKYFDSALNDKLNNPNWLQVLLEKVYGEKEKISFVYGDALQQTINSVGCGVFAVENLIKGIGLNTSKTIDEIAIREEHSALIDKYKGQDLDILKQELEKLDIFLRDFGDVLLPTGVIRGRSRTKVGGGAGDTVTLNPVLVGSLNIDGHCYNFGVAVVGDYAYVADCEAGLKIINIANRAAPYLVGSLDTNGSAMGVTVVGNYAYVADGEAGLKIINITNPSNSFLVGSLDTNGFSRVVAVVGNYAYVADSSEGLNIINIANPANPSIVGSLNTDGYAFVVAVVENYAYVADGNAVLKIVDITTKTAPALVGSLDTDGGAIGVTVAGNYAYVADYDKGLKIINIANPANPSLVSSLDTDGYALGVTVTGNYAYVADDGAGLKIINIADPGAPFLVESLDTDGGARGVTVAGNYAYVADYDKGLKVIEIQRLISKVGTEDAPIFFSQSEFNFSLGSFTKIQVTSLPNYGTLKLSGTAVTSNQEINIGDLDSLTFEPNLNWNGNTAFGWKGYDGTAYSASAANVTIALTPVQDLPIVSAIPKSGTEDTVVTFSSADFTSKFTDVDGDNLTKIKVTSLSSNGDLKFLNNTAVVVDGNIPIVDIEKMVFAPTPNWYGNTTFSWKGYDGTAYSASAANVDIVVTAVNDPPTVSNFSKTSTEDTVVTFSQTDFTSKFSDVDGNNLTKIKVTSLPSNGDLKFLNNTAVVVDGNIPIVDIEKMVFAPTPNWYGNTAFSWKGYDGTAYSASAANVTIALTPVQDLPIVSAIPKSGTEDTVVTFSATDFTSKFSDVDGNRLAKVKIVSLSNYGTLKLLGNTVAVNQEIVGGSLGNLTFEPNLNWNGNTAFSWKGYDGFDYSESAANVDINISAVNDPPTIIGFSKTGTEDTALMLSSADFISKFGDVDGDDLTKIQIIDLPLPNHGTLKLSNSLVTADQEIAVGDLDSLTFAPNLNWNGNTAFGWKGYDGFAYSASAANVNIDLTPVQDLPIVNTIPKAGTEDTDVTFSQTDFTNKFTDVDGDSLTQIQITSLPSNGTLKLSGTAVVANQVIPAGSLGNLTFAPNLNWNGNTSFSWKGYDGTAYSASAANVDIVVTAVNDPPTVSNFSKTGTEDTAVTFAETDFANKFTDVDGDSLTKIQITSLSSNGDLKFLNNTAVVVDGNIPIVDIEKMVFAPTPNWYGNTTFSWKGYDGFAYSASAANVTIALTPVQDLPIVSAIPKSGTEDTDVTFSQTDFTSKFTDVDGDSLTQIQITSLPSNGILKLSGTAVTLNQEIVVGSLGSLTFEPNLNWNGSTSFSWKGYDGSTYSTSAANVNIVITAVNDSPTVSNVSKTSTEDTIVTFNVVDFTNKFTDVDGDSLTQIKITSLPSNGILKLSGNAVASDQEIVIGSLGNLTFEPNLNWNGNTSFSWRGYDGFAYSTSEANVDINISAVNDPPTIIGFSKTGTEDTDVTFSSEDFISKFGDIDGDDLTKIQIIDLPLPNHGTLKLSNSLVTADQEIAVGDLDSLTFEPNLNWNGNTSFSWKGYDGFVCSVSVANIDIDVAAVNDAPITSDILKTMIEDDVIFISIQDFVNNFSDVDGDSLAKIKIVSLPDYGKLRVVNTEVIVNQELDVSGFLSCCTGCPILNFLPDANWNGNTSFSWKGYDGNTYSVNTASVDISISAVNDAPIISGISKTGTKGAVIKFSLEDFTGRFIDIEGDCLTKIKITSLSKHSVLKLSGNMVATNQEIAAKVLGNLTFSINPNWKESVAFSWQGYDGTDYSSNTADIKITVTSTRNNGKIAIIVGSVVGFVAFFAIVRWYLYWCWRSCLGTHSFPGRQV